MLSRVLATTVARSRRPIARQLSSAAVAAAPPSRVRRSLDPIVVTDAAANRLKELLSNTDADAPIGIRLGTKKRGCNGLSYTLNYVQKDDDAKNNQEAVTTNNGIKVFIEPMALLNVIGTTMDWEETELSAEFTFTNPNSKGECGCGESFNV